MAEKLSEFSLEREKDLEAYLRAREEIDKIDGLIISARIKGETPEGLVGLEQSKEVYFRKIASIPGEISPEMLLEYELSRLQRQMEYLQNMRDEGRLNIKLGEAIDEVRSKIQSARQRYKYRTSEFEN